MTAVDDFIADLLRNRVAEGDQPIRADVDTFIAALQEIVSGTGIASGGGSVSNGRLTLTTGVPVLSTDVTAATTIFFTPYNGNKILLNNGTEFVARAFTELSQTLADATKSPAAAAANSVYDMFVWDDAGTLRCTRGPAWTDATNRALAIERVNGILVNADAITNGPGENLGTYVGTIATDATPDCNMIFVPAPAAGGTANRLDVWNMYNRVEFCAVNTDSTATWAYTLPAFRLKNNNAANEITFVCGVSEDCFDAVNVVNSSPSVTAASGAPIALDSATVPDTLSSEVHAQGANGASNVNVATLKRPAPIGRHFVAPLEQAVAAGVQTWRGSTLAGTVAVLSQFTFQFRM